MSMRLRPGLQAFAAFAALAALAGLLAAGLLSYAQVAAAPVAPSARIRTAQSQYREGEMLVKFKAKAATHQRMATLASRGHSLVTNLGQTGWAKIKLSPGETTATALGAYQSDTSVESVQPNYIYHTLAVPNDPQGTSNPPNAADDDARVTSTVA